MNNFLPLGRELTNHWLWEDKPFANGQAWIDLLMLANHKDMKKPYKGQITTYKRGTVNFSITELSKRWGWSRKSARRFLELLENDGMIVVEVSTHGTTITIVNYEVFNNSGTTNDPTNVQPVSDQCPTSAQPSKEKERSKERERLEEGKEEKDSPLYPPAGEREEAKTKKRATQKQVLERLLLEIPISDFLLEHVNEWLEYKKERHFTYKERGLKALVRQVSENAKQYGDGAVASAISNSIASGYQGIVWDRMKNVAQDCRASPKYAQSEFPKEDDDEELVGDDW